MKPTKLFLLNDLPCLFVNAGDVQFHNIIYLQSVLPLYTVIPRIQMILCRLHPVSKKKCGVMK